MIGDYPSESEATQVLTFSQINLRDGRWKKEESQWNKRHLSMDEYLETPLAEATIKADNWNGASNRGWIPKHLP